VLLHPQRSYVFLFSSSLQKLAFDFVKRDKMAPTSAPAGIYDAALQRRQALMGKSGPAALVKNFRVFSIAMFACIGGLLYGLYSCKF